MVLGSVLISFFYTYPLFPAPFIEEAVIAPLYILASFVKNKVPIDAWVYFWASYLGFLKISMRFISSNVSFKTYVSLLIFCFDDLSISVNGVLKSPAITVLLAISPIKSVSVCLMY